MGILQGIVGPQNNGDSSVLVSQQFGQSGEALVTEAHGKYYNANVRGNVFKGLSASTGIALIVPATTGNHPTLWNPQGSTANLSIIRLALSYVSGTNAPTALEWAVTTGAGSQIGTAAPIVTFTSVAPTQGVLGGTGKSSTTPQGRWAPTTNTFTAAPVFTEPTGFALDTMAAASTNAPFSMIVDYDGMLIVAPNTAISLCSQAATTTALFQVMVVWEEIPLLR